MRLTLISWAITSSFLILAVMALRAALGKRMGAGLRYALWGLVLVRLLLPVQLFTAPVLGTVIDSEKIVTKETTTVQEILDAPVGPDSTQAAAGGTVFPAAPAVPDAPVPPEPPAGPDAPDWTRLPALLGWVWLDGSVAMALVLVGCNLSFYLRLRRTRRPLTADGYGCVLPVYTAEGLPSPCLFGVRQPAIYVTPEAAADPAMLRHVLTHEQTHYRHGDSIWNLFRCAALCVHWWNPLVWLAARLSRRDGELACDEGALRILGDGERTAYGNTLLTLVTAKLSPAGLLTCATTMTGDKKSLTERVSRIARAPKRAAGIAAAAVILAALVTVCAFGQKSGNLLLAPLDAELSCHVDKDGTVRINGTVDGLELSRTFWQPDDRLSFIDSPYGELSFVYPDLSDGIEGWLTAWWTDETHTAVNLSTYMMAAASSYFHSGYWEFTVDLSGERAVVTRMEQSEIRDDPNGNEVMLYPETIPASEAVRAGRIAARLLREAEECHKTWEENTDAPEETKPIQVAIPFEYDPNNPASDKYIPAYVLDAAKALAEEQFQATAPGGWVRTWGSSRDKETGTDIPIPLKEPVEFNQARIKYLNGPLGQTVRLDGRDLEVELWQLVYEFHAVKPEQAKVLLAGGMTLDEDGWMNFCGPNYLAFTGEGDSRTVTSFLSTDERAISAQFLDTLILALRQAGLDEVDPPPYVRDTGDEISDQLALVYQGREKPFEALWYHFSVSDTREGTVADLNGDGRDEIVVVLHEGGGTAATMNRPHIFDAETLEEYDTGWYRDGFLSYISSTGDEENFYLSAPGLNTVTIPKSGVKGKPAQAIGFGPWVQYEMQDGKLICSLLGFGSNFESVCGLNAVVELDPDPDTMSLSYQYRDFTFTPVEGYEAQMGTDAPANNARAELKSALLGEVNFTLYDREGRFTDVDISSAPHAAFPNLTEDYDEKYNDFTVLDLDSDGRVEVVIQVMDVAGDNGGYLVLRWVGPGDIRCYIADYRTFWDLKTDGTFLRDRTYEAGYGWARMTFPESGNSMVMDIIAEGDYAEKGTFMIKGESVTLAEFTQARKVQDEKADMFWWRFEEQYILQLLG